MVPDQNKKERSAHIRLYPRKSAAYRFFAICHLPFAITTQLSDLF